jgi:hypothetical protein
MPDPADCTPRELIEFYQQRGKGRVGKRLPDVTPGEEAAIRDVYDEFVHAYGGAHIHPVDPDVNAPLCESTHPEHSDTNWSFHPTETIPVGYRDVCRKCGKIWRRRVNARAD